MSHQVAFILGYGPGIGAAVAAKFKSEGFRVAVASRSLSPEDVEKEHGYAGFNVNLDNASDVSKVFAAVKEKFGNHPNAVVYGAASWTRPPGGAGDPFSVSYEKFETDVNVSGTRVYQAAQLAYEGFKTLPENTSRAFIVTGNAFPWYKTPRPDALGLGTGKKAAFSIIEVAAFAYGASGNRFYYATQVSPEGGGVYPVDGPAHAKVFWELFSRKDQGPWDVRFVKSGQLWTSTSSNL